MGSRIRVDGRAYQLRELLGQGAFGAVWSAKDEDGRMVAVKQLASEGIPEKAHRVFDGDDSSDGSDDSSSSSTARSQNSPTPSSTASTSASPSPSPSPVHTPTCSLVASHASHTSHALKGRPCEENEGEKLRPKGVSPSPAAATAESESAALAGRDELGAQSPGSRASPNRGFSKGQAEAYALQLAAKALTDPDARWPEMAHRIPQFIAYDEAATRMCSNNDKISSNSTSNIVSSKLTAALGRQDHGIACLVMSQVPGVPLNRFLAAAASSQRRPSNRSAEVCFSQLCRATRAADTFLFQLGAVTSTLEKFVFHRDLSPRNVMVKIHKENNGEQNFEFGLIDFGLTVDSCMWSRSDVEHSEQSLAGDGRYWPLASWMLLLHGWRHVHDDLELRDTYCFNLDSHAVGVVALQLFVELLPENGHEFCQDDGDCGLRSLYASLSDLKRAWTRHWCDISTFWQQVQSAQRARNSAAALRQISLTRATFQRIGMLDRQAKNWSQLEQGLRVAQTQAQQAAGQAPAGLDKFLENVASWICWPNQQMHTARA